MASMSAARRPSLLLLRRVSTLSGGPHAFDPSLRRLARAQKFSEIKSILETMKQQQPPNPSGVEAHLSSIITSYAASGMLDHAIKTLAQVPNRSHASLNALLSACNHHPKLFRSVPDLFNDLASKHSIVPDKISYGILIKSQCKSRKSMDCLKILKEMQDKGIEVTAVTYTTILDSLYKEKKPHVAEKLWSEMKEKKVALDVPAYNVRVMHMALSGKTDGAMGVIKEMEAAGLKPDTITYNYLIVCHCQDKKFAEAKKVYKGLKENGCEPNYTTHKNYVMALCKNGRLEEAVEVFNDALKIKKVPDLGTVRMLVDKLVKGKKVRAAKRIVTGLRKKFAEDFVGGWLELEKVVELKKDVEEGAEQVVVVA